MLKTTKLPDEMLERSGPASYLHGHPEVRKRILDGEITVEILNVGPKTKIKKHGHDNLWEVYLRFSNQTALKEKNMSL